MSDPQGPVPGALDHHHPYTFIPHHHNPTTSKHYQNGLPDLNNHHITLLKNSPIPSPWNLPPSSDQDNHPRLSDTFSEMRYLELNNWDLNSYSDGLTARLVDTRSTDSNDTPINYRPWEKPDSSTNQPPPPQTPNNNQEKENGVTSTNSPENKSPPTLTPLQNAFPTFTTESFPTPAQKLPSFQSQFNAFNESQQPPQLDTPPSLPSFHTLPATRYVTPHQPPTTLPMVTTPMHHHREPQPFLEDRHIQLFPTQVPLPHNPHHHHAHLNHHPQFPTLITQNGTHQPTYQIQMNGNHYTQVIPSTSAPPTTTTGTATLQLQELVPVPPMHTLLHPSINVTRTINNGDLPSLNLNIIENTHFTPQPPQQPPHQNGTKYDQPPQIIAVKLYEQKPQQNGHSTPNTHQPPQPPHQKPPPPPTPTKKGKRKRQENGHDPRTPHQVSSVSSTEPGYKRPSLTVNGTHKHVNGNGHGHTNGHHEDNGLDKPVKKKRKRCGECTGCQRKDNCGECAPCRNDKSHQICKMRRCDMLTEKKTPKSKLKNQQNQNQINNLQPQHV